MVCSCFFTLNSRGQDSIVRCYMISFTIWFSGFGTLCGLDWLSSFVGQCLTFPHCWPHRVESGSCIVGAEFISGGIEWPGPKTEEPGPVSFQEKWSIWISPSAGSSAWGHGYSAGSLACLSLSAPSSQQYGNSYIEGDRTSVPSLTAVSSFLIKCLCLSDKLLLLPSPSQLVVDLFSDLDVSGPQWLEISCLIPVCHAFCLAVFITP